MKKKQVLILLILTLTASKTFAQWNVNSWAVPSGLHETMQFLNADTGYCYEGVYQNGNIYPTLYRTKNQGQTWDSVSSSDSAIAPYFFDYKNGVGYSASAIYRTYDSGTTWHKTANIDSIQNIYFYSVKQGFAYTDKNIYKSTDSGKTWKNVYNNYQIQNSSFENQMSFFDASHGYLIGNAYPTALLYETKDSGNTWAYKMPAVYPGSEIFLTPSIAYSIGVEKSIDSGKTWQKMMNGIPDTIGIGIEGMAFTDSLTGYLLIHNYYRHEEIYKTLDGARSWNLQEDLGITSIANGYTTETYFTFINKDVGYVYNAFDNVAPGIAITSNAGGPLAPTGIEPVKKTEGFAFSLYPNPSSSSFTLSASLPTASTAMLTVYDIAGQKLMSIPLSPDAQGNILRPINTNNLSAGYYMVTLEQNGSRVTKKLLVE